MPARQGTAPAVAERLRQRLAGWGFAGALPGYLADPTSGADCPVLAVARELGVSNVRVRRLLDDAGVPPVRPGVSQC